MNLKHAFLLTLITVTTLSPNVAAEADDPPLRVAGEVDYTRYAGRWYEIARLPNRFEDDCVGNITATYSLRADGRLDVTNRCLQAGKKVNVATGVARRVKDAPPSVLEVRFAPAWLSILPMVWGDYRIMVLAPDYTHALIGSSDRKYLWVLARTPKLEAGTLRSLLDVAKSQGFDVSKIIEPPQGLPE